MTFCMTYSITFYTTPYMQIWVIDCVRAVSMVELGWGQGEGGGVCLGTRGPREVRCGMQGYDVKVVGTQYQGCKKEKHAD